jgi:transposase InsO family protein
MHTHSNATTNKKQRLRIRASDQTCRALAEELSVSPATVCVWRHRDSPEDKSCKPQEPAYAFGEAEEALIVSLRRKGLSLDDLVDAVRVPLPGAARATVHRVLVRHRVSRLAQLRERETDPAEGALKNTFKEYGPGFVHMDCFYLPQLDGTRRYCFVAIDRATRLSYLAVYENKDAASAADFFKRCLVFFPFRISKLLTDNGREFTLKGFRNRWGNRVHTKHALSALCEAWGIEHRTTRPYTPKTNGMVERMNGLTKEATVKARRYATAQEMADDLHRWFVQYNFCRPHRRIGNRTPYEAALSWYERDPTIFIREPTALLAYRS